MISTRLVAMPLADPPLVQKQVRAKLRTSVKRLPRKYDYPPDEAENAADLVLQQADLMASEGLGEAYLTSLTDP